MSDIDLTEAAQEVRSLLARRWNMSPRNGDIVADADAILTAALPHIERQVRERVAREIEAAHTFAAPAQGRDDDAYIRGFLFGLVHARHIARGAK